MRQHRYTARAGTALAIQPQAFGWLFDELEGPTPPERIGALAIVSVRGPLQQRGSWWALGYDDVVTRFRAACESDATVIMLDLDSPGGSVAGCFAAVREMREMAASAGKAVVAFANEAAYSAAYALATVASQIYVPESGGVGSVGVIGMVEDYTEAMAQAGVRCAVLTTGARKADGNPAVPMSEASIAALQGQIDKLGAQFFGLVAEARPLSAGQVQALEAACLMGQDAVDAGLADEVISRTQLIARLTGMEQTMEDEETKAEESSEETEASEDGKCAPESAEEEAPASEGEEPMDDEGEEPAANAAAAHSSRDILAAVRSLTGQTSPAAQIGALHALASDAKKAKAMAAKLARVEGDSKRKAHEAKVSAAIKAGKLAPAQRAWALGVDGKVLDGFLATASPVAPAKPLAAPPKAEAPDTLTDADRKVAASLGLSAEAFQKHKAAHAAKH
jgi:ClpP class serine protease